MRVLLGINGDTEDGWRERYRVSIIPQFDYRAANKVEKNGKDNYNQLQASEKSPKPAAVKQEPKVKVVV